VLKPAAAAEPAACEQKHAVLHNTQGNKIAPTEHVPTLSKEALLHFHDARDFTENWCVSSILADAALTAGIDKHSLQLNTNPLNVAQHLPKQQWDMSPHSQHSEPGQWTVWWCFQVGNSSLPHPVLWHSCQQWQSTPTGEQT
jgi:hypothetical protein